MKPTPEPTADAAKIDWLSAYLEHGYTLEPAEGLCGDSGALEGVRSVSGQGLWGLSVWREQEQIVALVSTPWIVNVSLMCTMQLSVSNYSGDEFELEIEENQVRLEGPSEHDPATR